MDTPDDAPERAPPFPFDAIYKALFRDRATISDMLRNHLAAPSGPLGADLLGDLDMRTLRRLPAEWVARDFRARRGDQVWCVDFRDAARGRRPARLFVHLEFQSAADRDMALRFLDYGGELCRELRDCGTVGAEDPCAILCVVVHNGAAPWRVSTRAGDIARLPPSFGRASVPRGLAAFYPWGYHALDLARRRGEAPVPGSVVSLIAAIEYAGPNGLPGVLRGPLLRTARGLSPRLRETVGVWLRRLAEKYGTALPELEEMMGLAEVGPVTSRLEESIDAAFARARSEGIEQGVEQGIEQGIERGRSEERALLCRMASLKFGAAAAEDMAALLPGLSGPDDLREVGECLIESGTTDELLACVRGLLRRKQPGADADLS